MPACRFRAALCLALAIATWPTWAQPASASDSFRSGRLHTRMALGDAFSGKLERLSDQTLQLDVEYEWSLITHLSMGLRAHPGFVYYSPSVVGIGLGALNRLYWSSRWYGAFIELGSSLLLHRPRFPGNSAHINILSTGGFGWEGSRLPLSFAVLLQHLSNGGLASQNLGWNALLLRVGYAGHALGDGR